MASETERSSSSSKNTSTSMGEVEETLARITSYKGVKAVMILHRQTGNILQSTWSEEHKVQHASLIQQITSRSTALTSSIDDDLSFLRIRSKQHEILVAPDKEYLLVVLQSPNFE